MSNARRDSGNGRNERVNGRRASDIVHNAMFNGRREGDNGQNGAANLRRDSDTAHFTSDNGRREIDSGRRETCPVDLAVKVLIPCLQ
jgi:hypothetical protein